MVHNLIRERGFFDNTLNLLALCFYNFYVMKLFLGYLDCYCSTTKSFLSWLLGTPGFIYPSSILGLKIKAFKTPLVAAQGFEGEDLMM